MKEQTLYTAHNIRLIRRTFDLTQKEFGALFSIPRSTVTTYESGVSPSFAMVAAICSRFKLDLNAFTLHKANDLKELRTNLVMQETEQEHVNFLMEKFLAANPAGQQTLFKSLAQRFVKLRNEIGKLEKLTNMDL